MPAEKQDANFVGLFIAREETNGVLPANPVFYTREPNTFDDLGGENTLVARRPFNPSRQRKKGGVVDHDADGGFNEDLTQNNMQETMEAFFFAEMRRKAEQTNIAAVAATDDFTVTSSADFLLNDLIFVEGFNNSANNGLFLVNGITDGTHISTAGPLTDEAAGPAKRLIRVGHQLAEDDASIALVNGVAVLESAAFDFNDFGLSPGEWVAVGGDDEANQFAGIAPFYARVKEVADDGSTITFDKTTSTIVDTNGADKSIQIFFGYFVKNEEDPDDIVKFTHTLERTLGKDDNGTQSENIAGFVFNEMTWNSPLSDKVNIDITGIGMRAKTRTGAQGPLHKAVGASVVAGPGEDLFNTSSNVFRLRLAVIDEATLNPTPLFARVTEWNVTVNNNVSPNKAQGTVGAFDTTAGGFDVDGEFTAYFSTVAAIRAVENNADVTFDAIYSKQNAAIIMDIPLLATGGGRLNVEQDQPIMLPLTIAGAESKFGHTALINWLPYVPDALVATG